MWYKCGDRSNHGTAVPFPNADPTAKKLLGTNFAINTHFCLAAYSYGNNATDTYTGTLWYNVL
jgi:hypothetical protein